MIQLLESPPACMQHMAWLTNQVYYSLSDDNGIFGYVATLSNPPECQVHFRVVRFSPSVLKSMDRLFPAMMGIIKKSGATFISAAYRQLDDGRMRKLMKRYGMTVETMMIGHKGI